MSLLYFRRFGERWGAWCRSAAGIMTRLSKRSDALGHRLIGRGVLPGGFRK